VFFTLDTTPPAEPMFELDAGSDTPPIGDFRTTLASVTLVGRTEPGAAVLLQETGATTTADAAGRFAFSRVPLALGATAFTVRASDAAGNASTARRTITRGEAPAGTVQLAEGTNYLTQVSVPVTLGEPSGTRKLRFDLTVQLDTSDRTAAVEDLLLVYL